MNPDSQLPIINIQVAAQDSHTIDSQEHVWKPVADWPYEVSDHGLIRYAKSKRLAARYTYPKQGKKSNYYFVSLNANGRKTKTQILHILIAEAFLGPRPIGYEVDHINGDRLDNRVSNLRYVTPSENINGAVARGHCGENRWNAVLNADIVRSARKLYASGMTVREISNIYQINEATLCHAIKRRNWKHVK